MKKPHGMAARVFQALTVLRRGRLSKTRIADPKEGLALEDKKAQELPIKVALIPVAELDPATCEEIDGRLEPGGLSGRQPPRHGVGERNALEGESGRIIEKEHDEFARQGDVDGNVG